MAATILALVAKSHGARRFDLASLRNLDQLPATGAVVIAAPLKIVSGSPLRVLALVEDGSISGDADVPDSTG